MCRDDGVVLRRFIHRRSPHEPSACLPARSAPVGSWIGSTSCCRHSGRTIAFIAHPFSRSPVTIECWFVSAPSSVGWSNTHGGAGFYGSAGNIHLKGLATGRNKLRELENRLLGRGVGAGCRLTSLCPSSLREIPHPTISRGPKEGAPASRLDSPSHQSGVTKPIRDTQRSWREANQRLLASYA